MTRSQTNATEPGDAGSDAKPDAGEGLRLLRAFMTIADPRTRVAIVEFVESMANTHARGIG